MNNYIKMLNSFYAYIQSNKVTAKAQALYFVLFQEYNKNYFNNGFNVKLELLAQILCISKKDILRHRAELEEHKLIKYECTKGNKNGKYFFNLQGHYETSNPIDKDTMKPVQGHYETRKAVYKDTMKPAYNYNIYNIESNKQEKTRENVSHYINYLIDNIGEQNSKELKNIDIDLLINSINKSNFLKTCKSIDIEFCIAHYNEIINGKYDDYKQPEQQEQYMKHDFTNFDFNSLYDDLDNINLTNGSV